MATSRKSSIGTIRRGPPKDHLPYRGDNPEVGKKTGIRVRHVERKSDGFEPFQEILEQGDTLTPPLLKARKKKRVVQSLPDDDDEYGEMSMEIDDTDPNVPHQYFVNSRQPTTPSSLGRVGSSSRPVKRSSAVDFDKVPSPKPRASYRPSTSNISTPGPSNLSKSFVAEEDDDGDDDDDAGGGFDDYGPENDMPSPPGNASFAELNGDDDQEPDEELPEPESPPRRKSTKGKGRAEPEEDPEEGVEDEIAHGMEGLEVEQRSEEEEEEEPISKRARTEQAKAKKPQPRAKPKPKPKPIQEERSLSPDGVRRSKRHRYAPLDWWRNEKVVYGRSNSGNSLVPTIREIRRLPQEPPKPLGKNKRKRSTAPRGKSTAANDDDVVVLNPEEGWDDTTSPELEVLNFETGEPEIRRLVSTSKMTELRESADGGWFFGKTFHDGQFIAAGYITIPPHGRKPYKSANLNTYVFYVIEGAVSVKVYNTLFIVCTGGTFMVPRGNNYLIENMADRDSKLFFAQSQKLIEYRSASSEREVSGSAGPPSRKGPRSSSAGVPVQPNGRVPSAAPPSRRAASTRA